MVIPVFGGLRDEEVSQWSLQDVTLHSLQSLMILLPLSFAVPSQRQEGGEYTEPAE